MCSRCDQADQQIIVAYYDPREALRAYEYFRARPVTFKWSVQPVSILCRPISKAEIDDVSSLFLSFSY
jgi:hypothetical protein